MRAGFNYTFLICWVALDIALSAKDVKDTSDTFNDPNASTTEKVVSVVSTGFGVFGPLGGYNSLRKGVSNLFKQEVKQEAKEIVVQKADDAARAGAKSIHGNSASSPKSQTGYEIVDKGGDVKKVGITGGTKNRDGSVTRANTQVNRENKTRSAEDQVRATTEPKPVGNNRREALEWEKKRSNQRRQEGHSMDMHKRT